MTFKSGMEMLLLIQSNIDLYNPEKELYVFHYNEAGSIAYYNIDTDKAKELAEEAQKTNEYWGAFLGPGGWICDDPSYEDFKEGDYSNLDWCNDNYEGNWIDTTEYLEACK